MQYGSNRKKTLLSMLLSPFLFCFLSFFVFFFGLFVEVVVRFFLIRYGKVDMREVLCNVYKKVFIYTKQLYIKT